MKYIVFADANVFLDGLLQRGNTGLDALEILELAERDKIALFISSSNLINVIYLLKKANKTNNHIISAVKSLLSFTTVISPNNSIFIRALNADFGDIEDGIQYYTALQVEGVNYFITSNIRDFRKAIVELPVVTPKHFLEKFNS